jgi:hypothetical protein
MRIAVVCVFCCCFRTDMESWIAIRIKRQHLELCAIHKTFLLLAQYKRSDSVPAVKGRRIGYLDEQLAS